MTQPSLFADPLLERRIAALTQRGIHPRTAAREAAVQPDDALFWRRLAFADQLARQRTNLKNRGGFVLSVLRDQDGSKYGPLPPRR
ncbi:hypothetical protein [Deinococcus multiflagellatus]|uniref:Uncharacterized protein n=1 Tax=Deinococcus multiflagellatus TaxID=1656887 RepID=A0ABW1ZP46_9DEIO|nr:hypothetical protein [Deinococcus multiflagellatus]MBZ9715634.1 hypothetical protein [Deinococcus multiflagellatus]